MTRVNKTVGKVPDMWINDVAQCTATDSINSSELQYLKQIGYVSPLRRRMGQPHQCVRTSAQFKLGQNLTT
ncbi:unnamed protein product [Citrullus colocynthis]|uniref:Uncharacterized protein n=1 Tax=Citrullus colocynthis TaxID=252529 RepID=A0ABP0YKW0_9ROSI